MSLPFNSNVIVDPTNTVGYLLISTVIATALWGMASVQTAVYFIMYKSDMLYFKSLVILLWALNTVHEILCIQALWKILIPKFGDISHLSRIEPALLIQVAITGVVSTLVQCFFIWRIWRFSRSSRKWMIPTVLVPASILTMLGFIVFAALLVRKPFEYLLSPRFTLFGLLLGVVLTTIDLAIAFIMCILLWSGRTGFLSSNKMILRLMNAAVSTGTITALFGIVTSVSIGIWSDQLVYTLGEVPLCAVYCNALLANLNSRRYLGRKETVTIDFVSLVPSISEELESFPMATTNPQKAGERFRDRAEVIPQEIYAHEECSVQNSTTVELYSRR